MIFAIYAMKLTPEIKYVFRSLSQVSRQNIVASYKLNRIESFVIFWSNVNPGIYYYLSKHSKKGGRKRQCNTVVGRHLSSRSIRKLYFLPNSTLLDSSDFEIIFGIFVLEYLYYKINLKNFSLHFDLIITTAQKSEVV